MNFNAAIYGALLAETVPAVIETDAEYERLEMVFNDLFKKGEEQLSPEEARLFALIANLLEDYERRVLPALVAATPLETLRFLMRPNDPRRKAVVEIFGSQGIASEAPAGKREIGRTHARRFAERFNVAADLFL